jgi:hypothetical protein
MLEELGLDYEVRTVDFPTRLRDACKDQKLGS